MVYVTRRETFCAAHRLFNPNFSDEQNEKIFGKCSNPNWHGHNYVLEVTVAGVPNPNTGYVIDLKKLKKIINEEIFLKVDHKHLNFDVDFLSGIIPTVENLAVKFWQILAPKIVDGKLYKIKLCETPESFVEYFGEPIEIKIFNLTGEN